MKTQITIALLALSLFGCTHLPKDYKVVSLSFRRDPIDHRAEEAIDQIMIFAPLAKVYSVGKLPTDWDAGIGKEKDGSAECTINCAHESFAEPDIHVFDGLIRLLVKEKNESPQVKVRMWITRGPLGPGRIIDLEGDDVLLR